MSLSSILCLLQTDPTPGNLDRSSATVLQAEQVGSNYILLIRRYRVTSGSTLPAKMAPSPTAAATSTKIFICCSPSYLRQPGG
jgi:hypothetical protein